MTLGEQLSRLVLLIALFSATLASIAADHAFFAAIFGVLFGTDLERLLMASPERKR